MEPVAEGFAVLFDLGFADEPEDDGHGQRQL
jgi:hypothetical protein